MDPARQPLRLAKAFYFLYYAAWASLVPFLALYYQSLGFAGAQIGLLASISPLTTLFAAPFWGGLADATHRHKAVMLAAIVGAGLAVMGLSQTRSFALLAGIVVLYAFFAAPIIPLLDNTVLALLGDRRDRYGAQRLWGAIGWGLSGPVAGALVERLGISWAFSVYLTLLVLVLIPALRLPIAPAARPSPYWSGMRRLLADRRWFIFLFVAFVSGSGLSVISNYLFLYLDQLNASRTVMGLALTVATLSEIPVLFFSGRMLRRWGPRGLLMFSLAASVMRAYLYAAATEPWQALLIQLFHGLTFSTMWVAGVSFAGEIAPPGLGGTAQGMFTSTVMGLGGISGALAGGILLDRVGASGMYFWSGTAVLVGLLVFTLFGRLGQPRQNE